MKHGLRYLLCVATFAGALVACSSADGQRPVVGAKGSGVESGYNPQAASDLPDGAGMNKEFAEANPPAPIPDPFLGFRWPDHEGKYVNVRDGERRSYEPAGLTDDAPEVWFFGGSALYGFGTQRDDHTVPSEFARAAERDGVAVRVRNFGSPAYVNFQEVSLLAKLLASGRTPDLVIFFDGYNDQLFYSGRDLLGDPGTGQESYVFFSYVVHALEERQGTFDAEPTLGRRSGGPVDSEQSLDFMADTMGKGMTLAETLGKGAGFPVMFTIQPDLHSKELVGDEPQVLRAAGYDDTMIEAMRSRSAGLRARLGDRAVDLSNVFDGIDQPIFADPVHTNEQGAAIVGAELWSLGRDQLDD